MNPKDPPAFPGNYQTGQPGMTLRDYFAGQAMQALAADESQQPDDIATVAYQLADAMLEERASR
jgi:hypothetical protein